MRGAKRRKRIATQSLKGLVVRGDKRDRVGGDETFAFCTSGSSEKSEKIIVSIVMMIVPVYGFVDAGTGAARRETERGFINHCAT
jgi:hypothetical protein